MPCVRPAPWPSCRRQLVAYGGCDPWNEPRLWCFSFTRNQEKSERYHSAVSHPYTQYFSHWTSPL